MNLATLDGAVPDTGQPPPPPPPESPPSVEEQSCPEGALWFDRSNPIGGLGFDSVRFQPDETKHSCIRLLPENGNAEQFKIAASGWGNDCSCEALSMELVSWPSNSTAAQRHSVSSVSRSPMIRIASHSRFDRVLFMDGPPGLYIVTATEEKGVREPGEEVCRSFRIGVALEYRDLN